MVRKDLLNRPRGPRRLPEMDQQRRRGHHPQTSIQHRLSHAFHVIMTPRTGQVSFQVAVPAAAVNHDGDPADAAQASKNDKINVMCGNSGLRPVNRVFGGDNADSGAHRGTLGAGAVGRD